LNSKFKLAIISLTSCAGCENAILNASPEILDFLGKDIEIVYAPIIMDSPPPSSVDIVIVTGAVRTEEDVKKLVEWRDKSKIFVSFGSCSCFGGIPGLANFFSSDTLLKYSYLKQLGTINVNNSPPSNGIPNLTDYIKPLRDYVKVDLYVPGCPPPNTLVVNLFKSIISGEKFTLSKKSVCDECPLNTGKEKVISKMRRWAFSKVDKDKCFLEQGFICLGPATRGGCGARCIKAGYPCRGCMGPAENCEDQAAKMISAISSATSIEEVSTEDLTKLLDLAGTFYRFTLPFSLFKRKIRRG